MALGWNWDGTGMALGWHEVSVRRDKREERSGGPEGAQWGPGGNPVGAWWGPGGNPVKAWSSFLKNQCFKHRKIVKFFDKIRKKLRAGINF